MKKLIPIEIVRLFRQLNAEYFYSQDNYKSVLKFFPDNQELINTYEIELNKKEFLFNTFKDEFIKTYVQPECPDNKTHQWELDYFTNELLIDEFAPEHINVEETMNTGFADSVRQMYFFTDEQPDEDVPICPDISFQITDDCNLNCSYCYQINKGHHVMPFEIAKTFIDLLIQNNKNTAKYFNTTQCKGIILTFIGGEPLLQVDLIDQIVTYFRQQVLLHQHPWRFNWIISIATNGTLYFTPKVQKFIEKYKDNLFVGITIDGNKTLHDSCRKFHNGEGSYDIVIAGIRHYMQHYKKQPGCKMTFSPQNISYLTDAVKNLIQENYRDIYGNCVFEKGWSDKDANIFYNQLKEISDYILQNNLDEKIFFSLFKQNYYHPMTLDDTTNWCGGNARMLALDWKGDIYPCIRYMESSLGPNVEPVKIGNVNTGLMTESKCINCIEKLKTVNRINQSSEECLNCPVAHGCGYCQAYNYQETGTFFKRTTYTCEMHKATSLANVYFWNSYYKKHGMNKVFKMYLPKQDALKIISENEYNMLYELQKEDLQENYLK